MLSTIFTVRSGLFSSDGGCNEPPVHCSNGIQDEDEVGVDCGGTCPACNSSGGYWVGCSIGDHYSPIVSCYPRQNYLNIYGCLNGATNGPSRVMYSDNYNIGTPSFHFTSGRVTIYADCNEHNSCSTCGDAMPHSGSIHLVNGFKFMANSLANEIRFIITDLAERSIEPNAMICPPSTSDPCPSNQHYKIGPDNSINYSTKTYTTSSENKILTYPNPVHGLLSVDLNSNQETIWELCDGTNRIILVGKSVSDFTIDFYLLETGVYFLKVFNNDEIYLERIIHY